MSGAASIAFASEIDAEWLKMQGGLRDAVIYIVTEGLARLTEKSPVADPSTWRHPRPHVGGTFRANWLVSIGSSDDGTKTETLGAFAGRNSGAIASYAAMTGFPVIYLQNNMPYALRLENGWSKQAPSGVVAMTVAELEMIWSGMGDRL